jgi:MFS family permease
VELRPTPETTAGLARVGILRPLRIRDFALLWAGAAVSLAGDGVYVVALAWQVYALSDSPTALSLVGVAWTLPIGLFVLLGGVVSDRFERRRIMIGADLVSKTWSCYQGGERACGICPTCAERLAAFKELGLSDPLPYAQES